MKIVHHIYSGKASQPTYQPAQLEHEESVRARENAFDRLRELYNQGMPFFSKEVFRHVVAQLDHCRANPRPPGDADPHVISIPALDGTTVKLELETGQLMVRESDVDFIVYATQRSSSRLLSSWSRGSSHLRAQANPRGLGSPLLQRRTISRLPHGPAFDPLRRNV